MKGSPRIPILSGLLAVLVALYLVGVLLLAPPPTRLPEVARFARSGVDGIEIVRGGTRIELSRDETGRWWQRLGGKRFPADGRRIDRFLLDLRDLTSYRVASTNRADWRRFSVDAPQATRLTLRRGSRSIELFVGKADDSGIGVYARPQGDDRVFLTDASLASSTELPPSAWSYLKILPGSLGAEAIQEIGIRAASFRMGGEAVAADYLLVSTIRGGAPRWVVHGGSPRPIDPERLLSLESELLSLSGDEFVPGPSATGLSSPVAEVLVVDDRGRQWTLDVGARAGQSFYVARSDLPYVYLVNGWTLARIVLPLKALLTPEVRSRESR